MKTLQMKTALLATALAGSLFAGVAGASTIEIDVPHNVHAAKSTVTRAEVLADGHMWRLAGLQELNSGYLPVDTTSDEYQRAYEIYLELRASPQFAALVQQLQQSPGAIVVARSSSVRVAQTLK